MKAPIQVAIIVIALGVAAYMVITTLAPPSAGREQGFGDIEVSVVSAAQVLEDYAANSTVPDAGLRDLWFVVHGTIAALVAPEGQRELAAVMLDTGSPGTFVECRLKDPAQAKSLKVGQEVGIAGRGAPGAMANIPMFDCWVLAETDWKGKSTTTIHVPAPAAPAGGA